MSEKQQILKLLSEEFDRWEAQLAGLSEAQITAPVLPPYLSIKDVIAHLMAWQQVSIARLEAAQANTAPVYPGWLGVWTQNPRQRSTNLTPEFMKPTGRNPGCVSTKIGGLAFSGY